MNNENAHLYLPLVKALSEGKTIQFRLSPRDKWRDHHDLFGGGVSFHHHPDHYRIKPEPKVVWVNFYNAGSAWYYPTKEGAVEMHDPSAIAVAVRVELPEKGDGAC